MSNILDRIAKGEGIMALDAPNGITNALGLDMEKAFGYAMEFEGRKFIFINERCKGWEDRHILAHEIGHHLMGHVKNDTDYYVGKEYAERDAQMFAAVMLALMVFKEYEKEDGGNAKKAL